MPMCECADVHVFTKMGCSNRHALQLAHPPAGSITLTAFATAIMKLAIKLVPRSIALSLPLLDSPLVGAPPLSFFFFFLFSFFSFFFLQLLKCVTLCTPLHVEDS
jgi:hypothetical protein